MRYIKPEYFDHFRCAADQCPDTCCAGWQIMIDEDSLDRYAQDGSTFRNRLLNGIDWREGSFSQYQGRCSMLNDNNLCDLVIEKGDSWLCQTCSRYPRHVEEFEGLREWSLSLSCPVAAEMMLRRQEPVRFLTEEDEQEDPLEEEFEDFDYLLFTQLEDARNVLFSIVQNRGMPMEQRLAIIMEMAGDMQKCVDEERLFDMDEVIRRYAETSEKSSGRKVESTQDLISGTGITRYENLKKGFDMLKSLERLREDWTEVLDRTEETLYEGGFESYRAILEAFNRECTGTDENRARWEIFQEQIVMFFLYTYFCGAVYDDCIYSKVAIAVFSVCFIREFIMSCWFLTDKYINAQECIRLVYRYAREVEHSDENLNQLEEWLMNTMQS